ncbi:MAG: prolyl oligopeptidase family serine peptidase [Longimonas sp.]|uniref:carboxylesterase family protein n=1 Tax=Longimonas sp. TaxID=2039626 RepID=UPI003974738E
MASSKARSIRATLVHRVQMRYIVAFPSEYRSNLEKKWPLLLFLHGAGERGSDLKAVTRHGPLAETAASSDPFVVVAPQCPEDTWWDPHAVYALVRECHERYRVNPSRLYGTGISMGGTGIWNLSAKCPRLFAAIAPICGRADPLWASALTDVPIWAVHGAQDPTIPYEQSRTMVDAVQVHGGTARLTLDPEAGHDVWTRTYANSALYDWMLQHERKASLL